MDVLKNELNAVLEELSPYLGGTPGRVPPDAAESDADRIPELIDRLEPLLKSGNPECLKMTDELRVIPGSSEMIRLMEEYQFGAAAKALRELKGELEEY